MLTLGLGVSTAMAAPIGATLVTRNPVPEATGAKLVYNGGPVLQNVKVVTVYWGKNVAFSGTGTQSLDAFYKAVTASAYYDWLLEYNTTSPAQKIGRGTFGGTYAYTAGATGTVSDASIQTALGKLIDAGSVPAPDANTLYAIHFAPGINITGSDGSASCQVFCAYHGSFTKGSNNVYYSIVPDQGGNCAGGCGADASTFNNTTSVSSHELVEATTDADVGQNNLAWYDMTNGEIGDICNAQQGTIVGYTVQKEWSNSFMNSNGTKGACIVNNPAVMVNDFTVAATPSTAIDVPQGGMATVMVAMTKTMGTAENVNLTATAPTGLSAAFSPTSASDDAGKSTLTITAQTTAMLGMGKVTISAAGSTVTHTLDVQVNVVSPPDMAMQPDMAEPTGGGSGGTGGGGNGGSGGGTGTGGNGNGGGNGNNGGGGDSGCSISGGSIAGSWAFAGLILLALAFRRRRA